MLEYLMLLLTASAVFFSVFTGNIDKLSQAALNGCGDAVSLCITLAGSMALWGGIMRIAEKCGITRMLTKLLSLPLSVLFKDLDDGKAMKLISLNTAANLLGLGNAATPAGLRAMSELKRTGNDSGKSAAVFILLNTASIQLIPVTVASLRQAHGSEAPWGIMLPTVITSLLALAAGLLTANILYMKGESENADDRSRNYPADNDSSKDQKGGHRRKLLRRRKG